MKQVVTQGIILSRTDFGEADRILHFLTPDHGKISAIAKGVRKSKSKLAGGIELFSVSELSFIIGKSDIYTITSTRLIEHFDNIVKDINRTNIGYDFIRLLDKSTEDNTEPAYFKLLSTAFEALNDLDLNLQVTVLWFNMQLIKLAGHQPNLQTDTQGNKLDASKIYSFDFDRMQFVEADKQGGFDSNQIKFLRLAFATSSPQILNKVKEKSAYIDSALSLAKYLQI